MRILAVDIGFGYCKATDGRRSQAFKSIVGEANPAAFSEALLPGQEQAPRHFEIGGESVFVGELAEAQSRGRGFTLDPAQFLSQYAKTLGLAALVPFADHSDPVRLVTGLPISLFRRHRESLGSSLLGRHSIGVYNGAGQREEKTLYVEKVRVIPQPFGSLYNLMLDSSGRVSQQRFTSEKIGVIDVGFRTCDFAIADKTRYSERGSQSSDSGICLAYDAIANVLKEKSGVQVELYRLYEAINAGSIKIRGQRYELGPLVQRAFSQLAGRIATEANRLWAEDWDIDAIVLSGGGGAVLAPFLQGQVAGEVLPVPADQDARLNNVLGYWKYGNHVWGQAQAMTG
jgi:plasmid segregation protein ParM